MTDTDLIDDYMLRRNPRARRIADNVWKYLQLVDCGNGKAIMSELEIERIIANGMPEETAEFEAKLAEANAQAEDAVNLLHRSNEREIAAKHEVTLLCAELDSTRLRLTHMEDWSLPKAEADAARLLQIGEETILILADAHEDDHEGCRFQGATDPHVFCVACMAQEKLAEMRPAEQPAEREAK